jgi:hypothetical protein
MGALLLREIGRTATPRTTVVNREHDFAAPGGERGICRTTQRREKISIS